LRNLNIKQSQQAQSPLKASPMTFKKKKFKEKAPSFHPGKKMKVHKSTMLPE